MASPSAKRWAVKLVVEADAGMTAQACRALGMARSSCYRNSAMNTEKQTMQRQIVQLSRDHPRHEYRCCYGDGESVLINSVATIWGDGWLIVGGLGLQWQGGSRDTAFGRTEILLTGKTFQACESGVTLRFPSQSKTRLSIRQFQAVCQRLQKY